MILRCRWQLGKHHAKCPIITVVDLSASRSKGNGDLGSHLLVQRGLCCQCCQMGLWDRCHLRTLCSSNDQKHISTLGTRVASCLCAVARKEGHILGQVWCVPVAPALPVAPVGPVKPPAPVPPVGPVKPARDNATQRYKAEA